AIVLLYGAHAMEFGRHLRFSKILEKNHALIRHHVPKLTDDRLLKDDIAAMVSLVKKRAFTVGLNSKNQQPRARSTV
ncbi:MAG: hypothetical protein AAGA62_11685, partial [Bacteroidota bacterium]